MRVLAEQLEVDERTVRRYVEHLVDLDVPVRAVRGRYGGYRLASGFRLPPLMLTDDEALSGLLGLALLRRSGLSSDEATRGAEAKIHRVLPQALARRLTALQDALHLSAPQHDPSTTDAGTLLLLAGAARDRKLVSFAYRSASGRETARTIAPYGIVAHRGRWLVSGMDDTSGQLRTFRIDRITLPRQLQKTFQEPDGFDALNQVMTGIATAPRRNHVVVRAQTSLARARDALPPALATVTTGESGWVDIEIHAESLHWVPALLARLGCPFTIVEPEELNAHVEALGHLLLDAARGRNHAEGSSAVGDAASDAHS
ncbi:putative DNA-binding transcriptional regulator YafY [Haloactinopolyspora alba]|uniref:Putative DNA-binding transcriptional regulator YafY n=1 Tax=Haloactinopolyspora alba TaxID=648780 RepID=A0A2P8EEZ6_9ACTN|nr:putative DNA-binding transcriptional regulator YafY [Haloactinopolyspora alba]